MTAPVGERLGTGGFIQKNRFRQKQNPAKSKPWIPAFAE
jgi:hypothetical protein